MKTTQFTLQFTTPAFLGNATQQGQWRTPPFKALLRQWWRVAYAAERNFRVDVSAMRHDEGLLFGHPWLDDDQYECNGKAKKTAAHKSLVRIRLADASSLEANGWRMGQQQGVDPLPKSIDTSYAWFGLANRTDLPDRTGIKAMAPDAKEGTRQLLRLAAPNEQIPQLNEVFGLIHAFGLLGSRSRGGWGAVQVLEQTTPDLTPAQMHRYARPLSECLQHDWAMSLGTHQGQLAVWHSKESFKTWDQAMRFIAVERKHIRFQLKLLNGKDLRSVLGFSSPGRMPSPLRWKVVPTPGMDGSRLSVRIFAMPHRIPEGNGNQISPHDLQSAWTTLCNTLQDAQHLTQKNA